MEGVPATSLLTLLGTLAAAAITGAFLLAVALVARRTGQAQVAVSAQSADVQADQVRVNATQVALNDRELDARKEVWVTEISEKVTAMAHTMLLDAQAALDRAAEREADHVARIDALRTEVGQLRMTFAECEARCEQQRLRLDSIEHWARARGWTTE